MASILFYGIALPLLVAAALVFLFWRPWQKSERQWEDSSVGPAVLAASYCAAQVGLLGMPKLPPVDSLHWIFWLSAEIALLWVLYKSLRLPENFVGILSLILALLSPALILWPLVSHTWGASVAILHIGWGTGLVAFMSFFLAARAGESPGAALPLSLAGCAGGLSITLLLSASAILAQLAGALAIGLLVLLLPAVREKRFMFAPAAGLVFALVYTGLLLGGHFYAELAVPETILLAFAPFALWLDELLPAGKLAGWKRTLLQAALTAIPAFAAAGIALARWLQESGSERYY